MELITLFLLLMKSGMKMLTNSLRPPKILCIKSIKRQNITFDLLKSMKTIYDKKLKKAPREQIQPGKFVLVINQAKRKHLPGSKYQSKWSGPYKVKEVHGSIVKIDDASMDMIQTYLKSGFPHQNPSEHINQDCLVNSLKEISQFKECVDSGADSDCSNFDLINAFLRMIQRRKK